MGASPPAAWCSKSAHTDEKVIQRMSRSHCPGVNSKGKLGWLKVTTFTPHLRSTKLRSLGEICFRHVKDATMEILQCPIISYSWWTLFYIPSTKHLFCNKRWNGILMSQTVCLRKWPHISGQVTICVHMGVSKKIGVGPPKSSILIRFSIVNHPFFGAHPIFLETSTSFIGDLQCSSDARWHEHSPRVLQTLPASGTGNLSGAALEG